LVLLQPPAQFEVALRYDFLKRNWPQQAAEQICRDSKTDPYCLTNNYWFSAIGQAQEKPETLDWPRTRFADVSSITAAEMSAVAKKYLNRARVSRATISPSARDPVAAVPASRILD
jgi:hypothetical protein